MSEIIRAWQPKNANYIRFEYASGAGRYAYLGDGPYYIYSKAQWDFMNAAQIVKRDWATYFYTEVPTWAKG